MKLSPPQWTFCLCLFGALLCRTAQADGGYATESWQKAVIKNGQVIQVGTKQLPYPLILPKGVVPLGNKAEVREGSEPNFIVGVELFFSTKDETRVRHWAENAAIHFPVPLGKYQIVKSAYGFPKWPHPYRLTAQGKDIFVRFVVSKFDNDPIFEKQEKTIAALDAPYDNDDFFKFWYSRQSPIRNMHSFLSVRVYYTRVYNINN